MIDGNFDELADAHDARHSTCRKEKNSKHWDMTTDQRGLTVFIFRTAELQVSYGNTHVFPPENKDIIA